MSIPIIGQPTIKDWFFGIAVGCTSPCDGVVVVSGKPGATNQCPKCHKLYRIGSLPKFHVTATGEVMVDLALGIGMPEPEGGQTT